jgi:hypothetical protein
MSEPSRTSSLNEVLLGCGILRRDEDGEIHPLSASEVALATNAQKLKMMTTMYRVACSMEKPHSVSQVEYDDQMRGAQMTIGRLTAQTLNDLTSSRKAEPKKKSKRSSSKKKPYDHPGGC